MLAFTLWLLAVVEEPGGAAGMRCIVLKAIKNEGKDEMKVRMHLKVWGLVECWLLSN